ncbi:alpha-N-acetylgalactosaminide alpha-2,6-sialyltransferase 5-like [Symsagittifera roscoffensis]|uniref:alpha-N-acetylgalactosaminide alpha-2,6-sialyltransferase 5-like n=1 Tax=Symsagittifera roscoffensis TaxID=84072 RepID=UPI00307C6861
MNNHASAKFEKDVGQRTTHRVIAHSAINNIPSNLSISELTNEKTTYLIWGPHHDVRSSGSAYKWALRTHDFVADHRTPNVKVFIVGSKNTTNYFDGIWEEERGVNRTTTSTWLSTGFFTMVTALNICDQVTLFGFVKRTDCAMEKQGYKYHYDQKRDTPTACSEMMTHQNSRKNSHAFFTEREIFHRWSQFRKIDFKVPEWKDDDGANVTSKL